MPASKTVHYNPPTQGFKARCGRLLTKVVWRTDIRDCTCNNCLRLEAKKPSEVIA